LTSAVSTDTFRSAIPRICRYTLLVLACSILTACGSRTPLETPETAPAPTPEKGSATPVPRSGGYDLATRKRAADWCQLMEVGRGYPEIIKIHKVNDLINRNEYILDAPQWNKPDYWATPYEVLEAGQGDCEDFCIAKYYTLRRLGVPEHKLRFLYTRSLTRDQAHMVLAYYPAPGSTPLILDSADNSILPSDQRTDLLPVFSFNRNGLWTTYPDGDGKFIGTTVRSTNWKVLLHRMDNHERLVAYAQARMNGQQTAPVGMWQCRRVDDNRYSRGAVD